MALSTERTGKIGSITFMGMTLDVHVTKYSINQSMCLMLIDPVTQEHMGTASSYIEDTILAPGQVCIKDYSENQGIMLALQEAGLISESLRYVRSGMARYPVVKVFIDDSDKAGYRGKERKLPYVQH
jgi:hypothetical protein